MIYKKQKQKSYLRFITTKTITHFPSYLTIMLFISVGGNSIAYRHNHLRSKKIHLLVKTRDVKVPQMIIAF